MTESELLIDRLLEYFKVTTINELSLKVNIKPTTISSWRQRNSVNSIKKLCYSLDIFNEIFSDTNSNIQNIKSVTGINANVLNGDMKSNNIDNSTSLNIPDDTISDLDTLFKIAIDKNKVDELVDSIDDFIYEQKKILKKL